MIGTTRREFLGAMSVACLMASARRGLGAELVPANLQAQLVVKVAAYDRNFATRAGATALILVVQKTGDADSTRLAGAVAKMLGELGDIGGRPKQVEVHAFSTAAALAERAKKSKAAAIYVSTGFQEDMPAIGASLAGVDVLTYGALASYAQSGTVVAFDLEESKPKLVVHGTRAKSQSVAFRAELLKLARLVG